jgi:hypothetical protein
MAKSKSKYADLVKTLPKWTGGSDLAFEEKVRQAQKVILSPTEAPPRIEFQTRLARVQEDLDFINKFLLSQTKGVRQAAVLLSAYLDVKAVKEALNKQESTVNALEEAYMRITAEQFTVESIDSLRLTDGGYRLQTEPYAQVKDAEAFRLWCIADGLERSMSLGWQRTNMLTKNRLMKALPEPDGVVAYAKNKLIKLPAK